MANKIELAHVELGIRTVDTPSPGRIPDRLSEATMTLLQVHAANGDLAWVGDMCNELEHGIVPLDAEEKAASSGADNMFYIDSARAIGKVVEDGNWTEPVDPDNGEPGTDVFAALAMGYAHAVERMVEEKMNPKTWDIYCFEYAIETYCHNTVEKW
jgi:hypothetical protein